MQRPQGRPHARPGPIVNISGYGNVVQTSSTNLLNHTTKRRTDAAGRTIEALDPGNFVTKFEYNANGNRTKYRDPNNVGETCVYDELGRDTSCTDTANHTIARAYNRAGQLIGETDAKTKLTIYAFDARGRNTSITDRLTEVTAFTYDENGNQLSLTDAESKTTSYAFDDAGRKVTETYPDHVAQSNPGDADYGIVEFDYDGMGRLVLKTDQKGETVTFVFDLAGRLEKRQYRTLANSPSGTIADEDEFTWDEASRILTAVKGRYSNTVEFTYDDGGRIETEALTIDGQTYTVSLAFDDAGRIDEMTYPSGNMVDFDHNSRGLLSEIIRGTTTLASFGYDDGGRETSRTFGNSLATTISYAAGHNLISSIANSTVGNYSYGWDANHNKTSETITGAATGYGFTIPTAGYDDDNRLIGWERHDSGLDLAWDLSPVGNWSTYTVNTVAEDRTHSDVHEITAIDSTPLTHDPKGNLTEDDDGLTYTWDFDNMLASVTVPTSAPVGIEGTHGYAYDALGRRVAKTVQDGMITTTRVFVHSHQRIIAQYPSGTAATSPEQEYVYGTYLDELIALIDRTDLGAVSAGSDEILYAHQSHQFHVIALTDSTGNVFERYAYTPYGEVTILDPAATSTRAASDIGNTVTYTGQRLDPETGLYHFKARMLHPRLGRFIGRDPLEYVDGASLYRAYFVPHSNDPTGTHTIADCNFRFDQCMNHCNEQFTACVIDARRSRFPAVAAYRCYLRLEFCATGCNLSYVACLTTTDTTQRYVTTCAVVAGTIVVIAGVTYLVVQTGGGGLVLVPVLL